MTTRLLLDVMPEYGVLQRVLVTLARRGFDPTELSARRHGEILRLEMRMEGPGSVETVVRQLRGLVPVCAVEVFL